ncbi:HAMP domain-containing histidine kinase [Cryobacterium lactosi]|uniref:histidine kinase n=1 Tax=Cryobacterium lactosi TaxID=1259202 RepID=A0A4R9C163_9MICO|nr:HAMP domain-containing sensor histidine kinase [Cryobacterium lactosi]TFD94840.1 HAMP domain-containing histidine kinase [Cryobacterium lactosi]
MTGAPGRRPDRTSGPPGRSDDLRGASLRLTLQFTALMLVVLVLVGGVVFVIVQASVAESVTQTLNAATRIDSPQDAPEGTYLSIVDEGRVMSSPEMPAGLLDTDAMTTVAAGGGDVRSTREVDGQEYRLLTTAVRDGREGARVVQVALDLHESSEELNRLSVALLAAGVVALAFSGVAAYWMARRAIRPLAEALALQRRFVADASHELRTPLTLLSTRAQLLRRRDQTGVPPDVTDAVDEIVTDTRALTGILEDLLIAADPRSVADPEPVDLTATAEHAVDMLRGDAAARGITLGRAGAAGPVVVPGSPAALLRLIVALVTNALDHAKASVVVSIDVDGRFATVRVADDGAGFAPEMVGTAFERFNSGRAAATEPGGTRHYGLGLAIVAEITRRHGGTVAIESSGPAGAAVVARLPLAR